jgi:lipopolysaccharide export system protein LptA
VRNNPLFRCGAGLALALAALGHARAQSPSKQVTQDELLRQIETLKPAPGAAVRRNQAVAPVAARDDLRSASAPSTPQPLFAEQRGEKPEKGEKRSKGPTEIVALEATFDQKAHVAVFTGEVVVTDPEFIVQADKLTAYLKHEEPPGPVLAPTRLQAAPPEPKPDAKSKQPKGGGLEKAIAEADPGRIVTVIQEKSEADGSTSRSIGHGKKVHFDSVTGDITLTGRPDVQQGMNTCLATDDSTIMILNRDGHMRVTGPHKTVIKDQGELTK